MKIDIDKLNQAELIDLNRRIVERLRFLNQMHAHAEIDSSTWAAIGGRCRNNPAFAWPRREVSASLAAFARMRTRVA